MFDHADINNPLPKENNSADPDTFDITLIESDYNSISSICLNIEF